MLYVGTDNSSNSDLILLQLVAYTLFRVKDNIFQCRIESLFLLYYRLVFNVYTHLRKYFPSSGNYRPRS